MSTPKARGRRSNVCNCYFKRKFTKRGLGSCLTDGSNFNHFSQIYEFYGENVQLTQGYFCYFHQGGLYHHTLKDESKPRLKDYCVQIVTLMQRP